MHPTPTHDETALAAESESRLRKRLVILLVCLLVFLLLTFIPPLINVSRFQRRIERNISASIGRTVTFDHVTLDLLPLPGFTLDNFVVDEDPSFGAEPILRADQVRITLRLSSLWRHRVEFSKIALTEPTSVNLVHRADGRWNIEALLLQASHIDAAPTAQRFAGPAARFPYIEATGARVNLKLDQEKLPFSLTEADFALWLPEPHQWHLRLRAHPVRTDTSPGDTGTIRVEGTLGAPDTQASSLAQVPIDLHGSWQDAQLGGLSKLVLGGDAGLRGDFSVDFSVLGSVGQNAITTDLTLEKARRAEFVPAHPLSLEVACRATAANTFHSFTGIDCRWPPAASDERLLAIAAELPDIRQRDTASARITVPGLPAATLLDWLSVATPHPPTLLVGDGTLAGAVNWQPPAAFPWSGELTLSGESLDPSALPALGPKPIPLGDLVLRSAAPPAAPTRSRKAKAVPPASASGFDLLPVDLPLGGKQPAVLEGRVDESGYSLHLSGNVTLARLFALADAIPQFGEGLRPLLAPAREATDPATSPAPVPAGRQRGSRTPQAASSDAGAPTAEDAAPMHIDLTAARVWGGPQTWQEATPPPKPHRPSHR